MQINQSYNQAHQQNFGAFHMHDGVKEALLKRASKSDIEIISSLIQEQNHNKNVDITLFTQKSTKLGANIYPKDTTSSVRLQRSQEGIFYKFTNPLNFIKKICKEANEMSETVEIEKIKKEVLKKLN